MNENDSLPVFPHFQFGFFFSQQSVAPIENGKEDGKRQARCMDEPCLRFQRETEKNEWQTKEEAK